MSNKRVILSEEQIKEVIESTYTLINSISDKNRKSQLKVLFDEIGDNYFSAPASSRSDYHDSCVGGLANHSLEVLTNYNKICKLWAPEISKDSIIICALLHDSGKSETIGKKPIYLEETERWKTERGNVYYHNPDIRDGLTHAMRSVRLAEYYGVKLTEDEYIAILAHDNLYVEENKVFKNKVGKMGTLLHFADYWTVFGK